MKRQLTIDQRLVRLEEAFKTSLRDAGLRGGWCPGTTIQRVMRGGTDGQGFDWTLAIGDIMSPKRFFTADTVEKCIQYAENELLAKGSK